jgi:putative (di)nucleoside polyphosphate hydrolase
LVNLRRHDADQRSGLVIGTAPLEHDETHVGRCRGGVDPDHLGGGKRELYEETSVRSVEKLGEVPDWRSTIYRIVAGRIRLSRTAAKWFAVR